MALCHHKYPPFVGVTSEQQGYDCAHYGAPVYQFVFLVPDQISADDLADEVLQYQHELRSSAPVMCLAFEGRGVVCPIGTRPAAT